MRPFSSPSEEKYPSEASYTLLHDESSKKKSSSCFGFCVSKPVKFAGKSFKCYYIEKKTHRLIFSVFMLSVLSYLIAAILPAVINSLMTSGINDELIVSSTSSPSYSSWQTNTGDDGQIVYYDIYVFNIQNPVGVLYNAETPILIEYGPYVYREYFNKFDIEWTSKGEYVSFYTQKYYIWDKNLTGPGLDPTKDVITNINLITQAVEYTFSSEKEVFDTKAEQFSKTIAQLCEEIDKVRWTLCDVILPGIEKKTSHHFPKFEKLCNASDAQLQSKCDKFSIIVDFTVRILKSLDIWKYMMKTLMCVSGEHDLFMERTPQEMYFGWDNDPLILTFLGLLSKFGQNTTGSATGFPGIATNYTSEEYTRKISNKDTFNTGSKHISKVDAYLYYQNMSEMRVCLSGCPKYQSDWTSSEAEENGWTLAWATSQANAIIGTDGTEFAHKYAKDDSLTIFISDVYRWADLSFEEAYDYEGISLRRYGLNKNDLKNAYNYAPNSAYYQWCPDGMMNFTTVVGFPLFASKPHFLDGADSLITNIEGIIPNRVIHDTYLDVEPITGYTMRGAKRLQVSSFLEDWDLPTVHFAVIDRFIADAVNKIFHYNLTNEQVNEGIEKFLNYLFDINNGKEVMECLHNNSNWKLSQKDGIYIPFAWADEHYSISDDDVDTFKSSVYGTQKIAEKIEFWGLVIGTGLILVVISMMIVLKLAAVPDEPKKHMI